MVHAKKQSLSPTHGPSKYDLTYFDNTNYESWNHGNFSKHWKTRPGRGTRKITTRASKKLCNEAWYKCLQHVRTTASDAQKATIDTLLNCAAKDTPALTTNNASITGPTTGSILQLTTVHNSLHGSPTSPRHHSPIRIPCGSPVSTRVLSPTPSDCYKEAYGSAREYDASRLEEMAAANFQYSLQIQMLQAEVEALRQQQERDAQTLCILQKQSVQDRERLCRLEKALLSVGDICTGLHL
ncbi:hypothetical protein BDZ91DRAFT_853212 [Kalaharituber pfeilii]|nr:hypothetical protein BDZ91DRAFT_853212 [Kalaharituber pfeilii]